MSHHALQIFVCTQTCVRPCVVVLGCAGRLRKRLWSALAPSPGIPSSRGCCDRQSRGISLSARSCRYYMLCPCPCASVPLHGVCMCVCACVFFVCFFVRVMKYVRVPGGSVCMHVCLQYEALFWLARSPADTSLRVPPLPRRPSLLGSANPRFLFWAWPLYPRLVWPPNPRYLIRAS